MEGRNIKINKEAIYLEIKKDKYTKSVKAIVFLLSHPKYICPRGKCSHSHTNPKISSLLHQELGNHQVFGQCSLVHFLHIVKEASEQITLMQ